MTTFDESLNPNHEHQLSSIIDPNTLKNAFEERTTREPTRSTDLPTFLYGARDVLAEYPCAIESVGPFSVAFLAVRDNDVEDKFEPHYYATATDRFPHALELNIHDYTNFNAATGYELPWYLPATLVHAPFVNQYRHSDLFSSVMKAVSSRPTVRLKLSSRTYKTSQASSC